MTVFIIHSTVPSAHDVLVPETLLKKRKSDAKAREEKAAKAAETKKVSIPHRAPRTRSSISRLAEEGWQSRQGRQSLAAAQLRVGWAEEGNKIKGVYSDA